MKPEDILNYILNKYNVASEGKMPVEIPDTGRLDLAKLFHELGFKVGAEIGVGDGSYSKTLFETNPGVKMYGVDVWKIYDNYTAYFTETIAQYYEEVRRYFAPFPNYEIIKELSVDAVKRFDDNSLDFVYIDSNHQEPYITQDITEWSKKVRPGGIISGHDYCSGIKAENGTRYFDVIKATQKYAADNDIKPWFVLGLGERFPGIIKDRSRSWFWIKP